MRLDLKPFEAFPILGPRLRIPPVLIWGKRECATTGLGDTTSKIGPPPFPLTLLDTGGGLAVDSLQENDKKVRRRYVHMPSVNLRARARTAQVTVPRSPVLLELAHPASFPLIFPVWTRVCCPHARISNSAQLDRWDLLVNACSPCVRVLTAWGAYVSLTWTNSRPIKGHVTAMLKVKGLVARYHILRDQVSLREASQPCSLHRDERLRYLQAVSSPSTSFSFPLAGPT